MERAEILNLLQDIFRHQLDNDLIVLNFITSANDIEEWDSLTHIMLVVAIENHFKIKFSSREILSWDHIGSMIDDIMKKLD